MVHRDERWKESGNYDSLLVLTHFKGHTMGGFGGSNKNIGIGCADGRIGKGMIHTVKGSDNLWSIAEEKLMERITESTKSVVDHFGENIVFINILRNMSVDCDCAGVGAAPVVTPNIGIVASTDILAADQASVDLVYALKDSDHKDLVERIETRHGLRQLSYTSIYNLYLCFYIRRTRNHQSAYRHLLKHNFPPLLFI